MGSPVEQPVARACGAGRALLKRSLLSRHSCRLFPPVRVPKYASGENKENVTHLDGRRVSARSL